MLTLTEAAAPQPIVRTEKVIAEEIAGGGWLVMWPDGTVREYQNQKAAEKAIKKLATVRKNEMLVTVIEWRTC